MTLTVLDLRRRDAEAPARPSGRVVVIDDADTLLKHVDLYQDLIGQPMVAGLICVAVGDAGPEAFVEGVALTVPGSLRPDGERRSAVLWVGDPWGLCWAPHTPPTVAATDAPTLDGLVAALRVDEVFDAVLDLTAEMPGAVASPALRLAHGPAAGPAVTEAATAVARSLCAPGDGVVGNPGMSLRRLDAEHDPAGALLTPPIATLGRDAKRKLDRVRELVRSTGTGWSLVGPDRPTAAAGSALDVSARAVAAYRAEMDQLLEDMDGHLEEGRPALADVVAHGVAEPPPPRTPEIAAALSRLVGDRLANGATLPDLAQELQAASAYSEPQGVGAQHERVRHVPVPAGQMPPFPRRPLGRWILPVILLTCLATVLLAGPGRDGPALGLLLGLVWTIAGWLLLARRPTGRGEQGFGPSAGAALRTYELSALAGVAAGYALGRTLTDPPEVRYPMILFGLCAVLALVVALGSWRAAARRWTAQLPLAELDSAMVALDDAVATACLTEWQPMRRRRAVAAMAGAAAGGVDAIRHALDAAGDNLLPRSRHEPAAAADRLPAVVLPELTQVVRGDLVDLCHTALRPVWSAVEAPHGSADADVAREFGRLLADYRDHVARHGLMSPFREDTDPAPRDALMVRAWTGSPAARDALLSRPDHAMIQLCDSRQLGFLSSTAGPALIRFAPERLVNVLRRDPTDQRIAHDPHVVWTRGSEFIGALRLLPLRPESIRFGWDGGAL